MPAAPSPRDRWALLVALTLPTFITLIYFVWAAKAAAFIYGPLKLLQFAFPLLWVYGVRRGARHGEWTPVQTGPSLGLGVAFGLAVMLVGMAGYTLWLAPSGFFAANLLAIRAKVNDVGLSTPALFIACSLFYSLLHSLLEEYYWRWFVFRECRAQMALAPAIAVSSAGFMAHHVLVLAEFFHWNSPYTYLLSAAVAIGGVFWAWLYEKYGTLLGPWISHLLIDAMIFAIGYDLVFGS